MANNHEECSNDGTLEIFNMFSTNLLRLYVSLQKK